MLYILSVNSPIYSFHGIAHYKGLEAENRTALPCPGELLVEEHHSNYGEPWAGGRDIFEFLASATNLSPSDMVLEIGCGTLRVGLHFIQYVAVWPIFIFSFLQIFTNSYVFVILLLLPGNEPNS